MLKEQLCTAPAPLLKKEKYYLDQQQQPRGNDVTVEAIQVYVVILSAHI